MIVKKLLLATAVVTTLTGLYGCSEGDNSSVTIDATTSGNTDGGSQDNTGGISQNCPEWSSARNAIDGVDVCQLPSAIMADRVLDSDRIWYMSGRVTVGNGNKEMSVNEGELENGDEVLDVTLTIESGTEIIARKGTFANLIITRGSKIQAIGTAQEPIIFSSDDEGYDGAGEWGGLIIHGYGLHNECLTANNGSVACNVDSEGESGFAGGYTIDDDSGQLSYVVVTEGGYEFSTGNEINGISLVGVGSGTVMDHIQINGNADDGIEFYGGNVSAKYLVLTGNNDDSVDWDEGFQGNLQYVIVKQTETAAGNAIEADTEGTTDFLSKPTIANATFIGHGSDPETTNLFVFKKSSGGFIHNSIATVDAANSSIVNCVKVDGSGAEANRSTSLVFNNLIADCANVGDSVLTVTTVADVELDASYASQVAEANLGAVINWTDINGVFAESTADVEFLDATDYAGAVEPGEASPWYDGWIIEGSL